MVGNNVPCKETEINATINIIWKMSYCRTASPVIAKIANTIEAAPRKPTHEMNICCFIGNLNQLRILNVAIGLAIKIKNAEIASAGNITVPNFDGKESNPKQKKIIICINHEIPSRK